ncbi:hypothetical protein BGZ83_001440 [Gryganskiella cystojenkinii]|nr:hypothetical protein BGZ83_001440 [Gryganskiella cystojenkinii]
MRWIALGSLAIMALNNAITEVASEVCPEPATVTVTETSTVWAGSNWPTTTILHTTAPDNCPPSPRYSCYVVHTTTMSAVIPQVTIHMVLPQDNTQKEQAVGAETLNDVIKEMEELGYEAEIFETESVEEHGDGQPAQGTDEKVEVSIPSVPEFAADIVAPNKATITAAANRIDDKIVIPACMNYKTETVTGACPKFTSLPLNSDGCAIITSTRVAMNTYTVTAHDGESEGDDDCGHRKKKDHHKTHHHRHHTKPTDAQGPFSTVSPSVEDIVLASPLALFVPTKTFEITYSTHVSYTLSFDFTYGTPTASPVPPAKPVLPELPTPSIPTPTVISTPTAVPVPEHGVIVPAPSSEQVPKTVIPTTSSDSIWPTPQVMPTPPKDEFIPITVPDDLTDTGFKDDGLDPETVDDPNELVKPRDSPLRIVVDPLVRVTDPSTLVTNPPITATDPPTIATDPPTITTNPPKMIGDPVSTSVDSNDDKTKKACHACAEPCFVQIDVVAKAEIPLLQKLFENKIQKALASLKLTLLNDIASSSGKDGLFAKSNVDAQTSDLFQKTVEDKCAKLEAAYLTMLPKRCEKIVHETGCATGECQQSEVDKAVKRLDVMLSTDLARDASQLRTDLVADFKKKCDEHNLHNTASLDVEKRGLLGNILGENLGGTLDRTVESVAETVDNTAVKPLTGGKGLVQPLVEGLTDSVKTVVDSFVSNCNRKGLLDFDTEKGVGTLSAVIDLSLDLFNIVCVKANVDVKVPAK